LYKKINTGSDGRSLFDVVAGTSSGLVRGLIAAICLRRIAPKMPKNQNEQAHIRSSLKRDAEKEFKNLQQKQAC
jgi:hypothetical protein